MRLLRSSFLVVALLTSGAIARAEAEPEPLRIVALVVAVLSDPTEVAAAAPEPDVADGVTREIRVRRVE